MKRPLLPLSLVIALVIFATLCGCGRKGDPSPRRAPQDIPAAAPSRSGGPTRG